MAASLLNSLSGASETITSFKKYSVQVIRLKMDNIPNLDQPEITKYNKQISNKNQCSKDQKSKQ
jgi:hypothetical protein